MSVTPSFGNPIIISQEEMKGMYDAIMSYKRSHPNAVSNYTGIEDYTNRTLDVLSDEDDVVLIDNHKDRNVIKALKRKPKTI